MDINKLKGSIPDGVLNQIPQVISRFKIDSALRLSHFLSNAAHESGDFKSVNENLNYKADRLIVVFPRYFDKKNAPLYEGKQESIGNRIYGNRMGNGDEKTGDGFKYKGRGYFQLTGKSNYALFDKFVDDDILNNPDLVATKYPLLSAAWFWDYNKINIIADKGDSKGVIESVRKKINGGLHGIEDVKSKFIKFYNLLK